jgi:hypothetical protein
MASGEPHDHIKSGVRKGVTVERLELLFEVDGGLHESLGRAQPRLFRFLVLHEQKWRGEPGNSSP